MFGRISDAALMASPKISTSDDYKRQALFQQKVLFWFSLIGGTLAFCLGLVPPLYLLSLHPSVTWKMSIACTTVATAFELVAKALFRQRRESDKIIKGHYLETVQEEHLQEAERIVQSIADEKLRDREKSYLARAHIRSRSTVNENTKQPWLSSILSWIKK